MHELFEELEAWRPDWQQVVPRVMDAARCAGSRAEALYRDWLQTAQGQQYERLMYQVPNYAGALQAAQESADRLPAVVATMKDIQ